MKSSRQVGITSILISMFVCSSLISNAFQKPIPNMSITIPTIGKVGDVFPLTVDKAGSTGAVTWSASGVLEISNNQLHLTSVGTGLMTATIAEDGTYATFELFKVITVLPADTGEDPDMAQIWGTTQFGGMMNAGTLFRMNADGTGYTVMNQFASDPFGVGAYNNSVSLGSDGKIYMVLPAGGINNAGIIYDIDPDTKQFEILHGFYPTEGSNPVGELHQASSGLLYGVTNEGGTYNSGTLYSVDPSEKATTPIHSFDNTNGGRPVAAPNEGPNGKLYGVTFQGGIGAGVLYEYDPATQQYTVKHQFDYFGEGSNPWSAPMSASNGKMYGTLTGGGPNGGGGVYEFDPATGNVNIKINFTNTDLVYATAGFTPEQPNGKMYVVSQFGGTSGNGAIAEYTPGATSFTVLYNFDVNENGSANNLFIGANGKLYGLHSGGAGHGFIFEYDIDNNAYQHIHDFARGYASSNIVEVGDGLFFGITGGGDTDNAGVFFSYDRDAEEYTEIKPFYFSLEGIEPQGALAAAGDKLLITNTQGGISQNGSAMEFDMTTNMLKKTMDLDYTETGVYPNGWVQHTNKKYYGITQQGGEHYTGTVNIYDPVTHQITVVYNFPGYGGNPYALIADIETNLVQGDDGLLYGIANTDANGAIFAFDPTDNSVSKVYDFGTATAEGAGHAGVVFANHKIWGIANSGGANGLGLVWSYDQVTEDFVVVHTFESDDNGTLPTYGPIMAKNGMLYGTAQGNGMNKGVIYEIDPGTGDYTAKYKFDDAEISPRSLTRGNGDNLLGFTVSGGTNNQGYIFEYDPIANNLEIRHALSYESGTRINSSWLLLKRNAEIELEIADKTFGDLPFALEPTSRSTGEFGYEAKTTNITIHDNEVTINAPGHATIGIVQVEDDNFNSSAKEIDFCVNPAKPVITVTGTADTGITLTSSALTGNQWYKDGSPVANGATKTFPVSEDGVYYVKVSVDGCSSSSDEQDMAILGLEDDPAGLIHIYPNPASSELMVDLPASASFIKLTLLDHLGRAVESRAARPLTTEKFDIGSLPPSVYIVRVVQEGSVVSKVFVKR